MTSLSLEVKSVQLLPHSFLQLLKAMAALLVLLAFLLAVFFPFIKQAHLYDIIARVEAISETLFSLSLQIERYEVSITVIIVMNLIPHWLRTPYLSLILISMQRT